MLVSAEALFRLPGGGELVRVCGLDDAACDLIGVLVEAERDGFQGEREGLSALVVALLRDHGGAGSVFIGDFDFGICRGSQRRVSACAPGGVLAGMVDQHHVGAGCLADGVHVADERRHVGGAVFVAASHDATERVDHDQERQIRLSGGDLGHEIDDVLKVRLRVQEVEPGALQGQRDVAYAMLLPQCRDAVDDAAPTLGGEVKHGALTDAASVPRRPDCDRECQVEGKEGLARV